EVAPKEIKTVFDAPMELSGLLFQSGELHLLKWSDDSMVADYGPRLDRSESTSREVIYAGVHEVGTHARPTVAKKKTMRPTSAARMREWGRTLRMSSPSRPCWSTAAAATTMDWAAIILPMTPPAEFAAAMRTGGKPRRDAEMTCRLPKRAFDPA